ncbi:MAG: DUF4824 family protein [Proteobacteria bacterium]|nr:DUF4824 family protein [Pseudomonadota bacterium]
MKQSFSGIFRRFFGWGFLLLMATNIVVLGGVIANRSGEPEARLVLSERELQPPYATRKENSGLSLRLIWRVAEEDGEENRYRYRRVPAWFNAAKIAELGLDTGSNTGAENDDALAKEPVPKVVFIVLELDGEPYRRTVAQAERALAKEKEVQENTPADLKKNDEVSRKDKLKAAVQRLEDEHLRSSRLFAVDAGLEPKILRERYPDRSKCIIAKGVVEVASHGSSSKKEIRGRITFLLIENIHVPLEFRDSFEKAITKKQEVTSNFNGVRYMVDLDYGSHFEPWIASLNPTKVATDQ